MGKNTKKCEILDPSESIRGTKRRSLFSMAGEREEVAKDGGGEQKLEQTMPSEPYYHIFGYLKNQKKTVTTGPSKWNI